MKIEEGIQLLQGLAIPQAPGHWLDLGCGAGFFTEVLANVLPSGSLITAIDVAPQNLPLKMGNQVSIQFVQADFTKGIPLTVAADGVLMANSLHFVSEKQVLLQKLRANAQPRAKIVVIEYDTRTANRWVPYPIDYLSLTNLLQPLFTDVQKTGTIKSRYSGMIYGATGIFR